MHCDQAQLLISAMIDEEITPAERTRLDEHVRECSACQATSETVRHQDTELRALFASRQPAVTAVIERVIAQSARPASGEPTPHPSSPVPLDRSGLGWTVFRRVRGRRH